MGQIGNNFDLAGLPNDRVYEWIATVFVESFIFNQKVKIKGNEHEAPRLLYFKWFSELT